MMEAIRAWQYPGMDTETLGMLLQDHVSDGLDTGTFVSEDLYDTLATLDAEGGALGSSSMGEEHIEAVKSHVLHATAADDDDEIVTDLSREKSVVYDFVVQLPDVADDGPSAVPTSVFLVLPAAVHAQALPMLFTQHAAEKTIIRLRFKPHFVGNYALQLHFSNNAEQTVPAGGTKVVNMKTFRVTTLLHRLARAYDAYMDSYTWMWDSSSGKWTEALSTLSMEVLVKMDAFYENLLLKMKPFTAMLEQFSSMGSMAGLEKSRTHMEDYLAKAINDHDGTSVGRAFEAVDQWKTSRLWPSW